MENKTDAAKRSKLTTVFAGAMLALLVTIGVIAFSHHQASKKAESAKMVPTAKISPAPIVIPNIDSLVKASIATQAKNAKQPDLDSLVKEEVALQLQAMNVQTQAAPLAQVAEKLPEYDGIIYQPGEGIYPYENVALICNPRADMIAEGGIFPGLASDTDWYTIPQSALHYSITIEGGKISFYVYDVNAPVSAAKELQKIVPMVKDIKSQSCILRKLNAQALSVQITPLEGQGNVTDFAAKLVNQLASKREWTVRQTIKPQTNKTI